MKCSTFTAFAFALVASTGAVQAAEYTQGLVQKVDLKAKKVTIKHEELKELEMPAMTMVFRTKTDDMLAELKEGQTIEFVVERINGKLTVTDIK